MAAKRQFGVSTHLYHGQRLGREHLLEIAANGFTAVELFATSTHFDYRNEASIANLQGWLADAGLALHAIHAPIAEGYAAGRSYNPLTLASSDAATRTRALEEAAAALYIARRIPVHALIVHLGIPRTKNPAATDNTRDGARRSVAELQRLAEPLGVTIALEVIPNELSRAGSLVHFVEEELESPAGICLDFGHAHLDGDVVDTIETVAEHLVTVHAHDNGGRSDDHLVPFEGTIDWASALTAIQKVGYDGTVVFEIAGYGSTKDTLQKLQRARQRIDKLLEI